ncbi:MAG TPA: ATP-binding protein [Verrucomicrobiae bacterium]|nr:ATP-binding protein [Verrucomicrobiae bacterium]
MSGAVRPVLNERGELKGFAKVARDLTERKKMEDELRAAQEHLEEVVAVRTAKLQESIAEHEAFSYSLSHDMRAPLRAMSSFSQILLAQYGDAVGPAGRDYMNRIKAAAERLDHLIQDVLTYSRVIRQAVTLQAVDLQRVIQQTIQERPELQPAASNIHIEEPLLPVMGHEASLTQCVSNLLTNAVKFVPRGTKPDVRVWTEPINNEVRLWIQDNGIGIDEKFHDHIFGIFHRLHTEQEYEGTGIGLAIVRKAVERMGGTFGVESRPGEGSRFWLQLTRGTQVDPSP